MCDNIETIEVLDAKEGVTSVGCLPSDYALKATKIFWAKLQAESIILQKQKVKNFSDIVWPWETWALDRMVRRYMILTLDL